MSSCKFQAVAALRNGRQIGDVISVQSELLSMNNIGMLHFQGIWRHNTMMLMKYQRQFREMLCTSLWEHGYPHSVYQCISIFLRGVISHED